MKYRKFASMLVAILWITAAVSLAQVPPRARVKYLPPAPIEPVSLLPGHPRIIFKSANAGSPGRSFKEMRALYASDAEFRGIFDKALSTMDRARNPAALAAAWVVTADDRYARNAMDMLVKAPISQTRPGDYSNIWAFAMAWDWLYGHPSFTADMREAAAARISERLSSELDLLDDGWMAMWHGRNEAANGAMMAALAIGDRAGEDDKLARAAAHYAEALRAYDYSEGWPEGPSYWIHNRAAPYVMAADSFLTATGREQLDGISIRSVMRKLGLWTLYQYSPNGTFEPYGDAGYSGTLGTIGYWEMSMDYAAKLTRDPNLAAGADYFRRRSTNPYSGRGLSWYVALSYDPSVRPTAGYDHTRPELWLRAHLPQSMLFGRESLGVAFLRGAWGDPDELYASFKAGDLLAHHDHYDAGHFSIQRGGLLTGLTGVYNGNPYGGAYRLGYAVQSVASNCLLILAPGETSPAARRSSKGEWEWLSGGQRVISPNGFNAESVAHFKSLLTSGPHLERADITAYASAAGDYDLLSADLTAAYNSTRYAEPGSVAKVSLVTREFLYLRKEEAFVVYDRVNTTNPSYLPKFLLHAFSKPQSEHERLLAGNNAEDGILESSDRRMVTTNDRGKLTQITVLPKEARFLKIGGPNYLGYVEKDGDQSNGFNGVNLVSAKPARPTDAKQPGLWRTELEPTVPSEQNRFLNVLLPRLIDDSRSLPAVVSVESGEGADAVLVGGTLVVFARDLQPLDTLRLEGGRAQRCLLVDARPNSSYRINGRTFAASAEGVLSFPWPRGTRVLKIARVEPRRGGI
ncbi:MAG: hypothetical protein LC114_25640 [Bryobacterales bacterium]|nr:hypothetical protein [Bryobacterales bacterium]